MTTTFDVKVWNTEKRPGAKRTTYRVVWIVDGRRRQQSFQTAAAAESFRSELVSALRKGEAFDIDTGLPVSAARHAGTELNWYEFACKYVDMKWPGSSPKHRKGIAEALVVVTPVMLRGATSPEEAKRIRSALLNWGFNTRMRGSGDRPGDVSALLAYVSRNARPLTYVARPEVTWKMLEATTTKLDGTRAAARSSTLRRAVLSNALSYAVELGLLPENPIGKVAWRRQTASAVVDRRVVVSPAQAAALLDAVKTVRRQGPHLVAFFGCMYYAALRPEEAANLRWQNLDLPEAIGWGWINLFRAAPESDRQWTNAGAQREERALKHRPHGASRRVPAAPPLVALLADHWRAFPTEPDEHIFRGERAGTLTGQMYRRVWAKAREIALTARQREAGLAARPYDLRHAAVSTWLNAGVPAAQVANWAGHSVDVLLRIYASCIEGAEADALKRVGDAIGGP